MKPQADLIYEAALYGQGYRHIAGMDEVGRGAWAGPVVAGAVILPLERPDLAAVLVGVNDSKRLSHAQRVKLLPVILEVAIAVSLGYATHEEIDRLGIVPATRLAMQRALDALRPAPDYLLIDFVRLDGLNIPYKPLVKGDEKVLSIAAASIVAKVMRDQYMVELDAEYPGYGFALHKGYGTLLHRAALFQAGPCAIHRQTFAPIRILLEESGEDPES